jgi:hypothetical protein
MLWPSWVTKKEADDFTKLYLSSPVSKEVTGSLPECTTTDTGSMSRTDESSKLEEDVNTIAVGLKICLSFDMLAAEGCNKETIPQRSEEEKPNLNVSSFSEVSTIDSTPERLITPEPIPEMTTPSGAPVSYGLKSCPDRRPVVSSINLSHPGAPENPGKTMSEGGVLREAIPGESVVDDHEIQLADLCCDNVTLPCS